MIERYVTINVGGKENSNLEMVQYQRRVTRDNDNVEHLNHTWIPFMVFCIGKPSQAYHEITNLCKIRIVNCDKQQTPHAGHTDYIKQTILNSNPCFENNNTVIR